MKLALSLPWQGGPSEINNPTINPTLFTDQTTGQVTVGAAVSRLLEVGLYVGGTLMFFWAIWGVFDYIRAEGNKEGLAKARKKIQWAIVGFIILLLSFFISEFISGILVPGGGLNRALTPLSR